MTTTEAPPPTVNEILRGVRALLADEARWTKGYYARNAAGGHREENEPDACKWCLSGALYKVLFDLGAPIGADPEAFLWPVADAVVEDGDLVKLNDAPGTTHADVLAALDHAIKKTA